MTIGKIVIFIFFFRGYYGNNQYDYSQSSQVYPTQQEVYTGQMMTPQMMTPEQNNMPSDAYSGFSYLLNL